MKTISARLRKSSARSLSAMALCLVFSLGMSAPASADEADARKLLKGMSDYLAAQKAFSFDYDATFEVVTKDEQKLALASSGSVVVKRPDMIRATRSGGFADVEMIFDGKTLTVLGKNANAYAQIEVPGTIDHLVDELRLKHNVPLPAADLLVADSYAALMEDVTDVKDLGSAVIGGAECDYLAFRAKEVDWQIWIAHGERPYPCRYTITSKQVANGPQYTIQTRNWKAGGSVTAADFSFKNSTDAKKVDLQDMKDARQTPDNFSMGEAK